MVLRELLIKLGLDIDAQSFAKGELAAEVVKASFEKLVDIGKELVHSFLENINAVSEFGEQINTLAQTTGIGTTALQQLAKAASLEGISIESFSHSMILLSRNMSAAKSGSDETGDAFHKAGIKYKDAAGKLRPAEEVFVDISEKFKGMKDGAEKTALAMKLFGRSGTQMIPLLNEGREEMEEYLKAQVMSPEQIKAANDIVVIQRKLTNQTKALWRDAIGPLLPAIRDLYDRYLKWKKANGEIMKQRIREYVGYLIKAIKVLGTVMGWLIDNLKRIVLLLGIAGMGAAVYYLVNAMAALSAASIKAGAIVLWTWIKAAAPFLAIGAAIALVLGFMEDFDYYQRGKKSLIGVFMKNVDEWSKPRAGEFFMTAWIKEFLKYIKDAIQLLVELDEVFGDGKKSRALVDRRAAAAPKAVQQTADNQTIDSAKKRLANGLPLTEREKAALGRQGLTPASLRSSMTARSSSAEAPAARLQSGGGAPASNNWSVQAPMTINITQQPGQDSAALAGEVQSHMETFWQDQLMSTGEDVRR